MSSLIMTTLSPNRYQPWRSRKTARGNLSGDPVFCLSGEEEPPPILCLCTGLLECQENVTTDALAMLGELNKQVTETNATITIDAIVYRGTADERIFPLQSLTDESNAALADFFKEDTGDLSPGSNMHAGLLAAQEMLSNSTTDDRKYLVLISDGITYTWEQNANQYGANYFKRW